MRIKFICGDFTRTFVMVSFMALFVNPGPAMATMTPIDSRKCELYQANNGTVNRYKDTAKFYSMVYASHDYAGKKGIWEIILEIQQNTAECPYTQYIEEFFRIALIANEKSCENNDSRCAEYNNWAQKLYKSAVKNGEKSLASTIKNTLKKLQKKQKKLLSKSRAKQQKN